MTEQNNGSDLKRNILLTILGAILVVGCVITPILIVENVDEKQNRRERTAIIIVDIQNDFCDGGSLAVPKSLQVIEKINKIREIHGDLFDAIILSQDFHPQNHVSFASNHSGKQPFTNIILDNGIVQELWPDHCVQGSFGSQFHKNLVIKPTDKIIQKGKIPKSDSYSAFGSNGEQTGILEYLELSFIQKVYICGLAYDYCVGNTAIDSAKAGFETIIIKNASGFIDQKSVDTIELKFKEYKNIHIINDEEI